MDIINEEIASAKTILMAALKAASASKVIVSYSGSGDEGYINDVQAENASGGEVDLRSFPYPKMEGINEYNPTDLYDGVEAFSYHILEMYHAGWEINAGAQGEFTFDVEANKIDLNHGDCVEHYEYSQEEY